MWFGGGESSAWDEFKLSARLKQRKKASKRRGTWVERMRLVECGCEGAQGSRSEHDKGEGRRRWRKTKTKKKKKREKKRKE
jgi:hypothetical protein